MSSIRTKGRAGDLVDRYVNAVKALLPRDQQQDIAAELTDAIHTRMEAREVELGRALTRVEQEAIIQEFGHPIFAASRYGPQRSLIGPSIYPVYVLALKWSLGVIAAAQLVLFAIRTVSAPERLAVSFQDLWGGLFSQLIGFFGLITLVFAVIERSGPDMKIFGGWRAGDLPANGGLGMGTGMGTGFGGRRRRPGRLDAAIGLAVVMLMLGWGLVAGFAPALLEPQFRPDQWLEALGLTAAPIWFPVLWTLWMTSIAMAALTQLMRLANPHDPRSSLGPRVAGDAINIAMAGVALTYAPLISQGAGGMPAAAVERIDTLVHVSFAVLAVGSAIDAAWAWWNAMRPRASEPAGA